MVVVVSVDFLWTGVVHSIATSTGIVIWNVEPATKNLVNTYFSLLSLKSQLLILFS